MRDCVPNWGATPVKPRWLATPGVKMPGVFSNIMGTAGVTRTKRLQALLRPVQRHPAVRTLRSKIFDESSGIQRPLPTMAPGGRDGASPQRAGDIWHTRDRVSREF